jgi:hypothetical protein
MSNTFQISLSADKMEGNVIKARVSGIERSSSKEEKYNTERAQKNFTLSKCHRK